MKSGSATCASANSRQIPRLNRSGLACQDFFRRNSPIPLASGPIVANEAPRFAPSHPGFGGNTRENLHTMARLFGIEIPNEKRVEASLPYIYGIGRNTASRILDQAGIDPNIRTGQLNEDQLVRIAQVIQSEGIVIEGDLRREKQAIMKRLTSINSYRGIRHKRGLPVRGQRTRTNARTRKGKRRTVGVIAKKK